MLGTRILIIDDNADWQALLGNSLRREGFDVTWAATGAAARACLQSACFDLVILDVRLPDCKGDDLCLEIRKQNYVPIIMVSAFEKEAADREVRLRTVADYFFQKPVNHREIVAQVWALLRMTSALKRNDSDELRVDDYLCIYIKRHVVTADGQTVDLTPREFDLLVYLAQRAGKLCKRDELIDGIWGEGGASDGTLTTAIARLRKKIERDPHNPQYILTVQGRGYKFRDL